jgi:uncharacterized lipoprotein YbaY
MLSWPVRLTLVSLVCAACGGAVADAGNAVSGTAVYGEGLALPPGVVFEASLEDVSRMDVAADIVASFRIEDAGNPPYSFVLAFSPARIVPSRRYAVRARVTLAGRLLFTSDRAYPVITNGSPTTVEIALKRPRGSRKARRPVRDPAGDLHRDLALCGLRRHRDPSGRPSGCVVHDENALPRQARRNRNRRPGQLGAVI